MTSTITNVKELITALEMFHPDTKVISREPPFTGVKLVPQMGGNVLIAAPEKDTYFKIDLDYYRKLLAEDPTNVTKQKQLVLLEDAAVIHRVHQSPSKKNGWYVDTTPTGDNS